MLCDSNSESQLNKNNEKNSKFKVNFLCENGRKQSESKAKDSVLLVLDCAICQMFSHALGSAYETKNQETHVY